MDRPRALDEVEVGLPLAPPFTLLLEKDLTLQNFSYLLRDVANLS